jgi:hypothetical protein
VCHTHDTQRERETKNREKVVREATAGPAGRPVPVLSLVYSDLRRRIHACHMRRGGGYMLSCEEEDTCMSYEEEDACQS